MEASRNFMYYRPSAGLVSKEDADKYQMVHIGFSVYIHADQYFDVIRKKNDGQAMVRILMNFLFSKEQMKAGTLSERGCGQLLDPIITKAIVMWVQKTQENLCSPVNLRQAMYRKLSYHKWRAKKDAALPGLYQTRPLLNKLHNSITIKEESDDGGQYSVQTRSAIPDTPECNTTVSTSNAHLCPAQAADTTSSIIHIQTTAEYQPEIDTSSSIPTSAQNINVLPVDYKIMLANGSTTPPKSPPNPIDLIAKERGAITVNVDCFKTLLSLVCCPICHLPVDHRETIEGFKAGTLYSLQLFCISGHSIQYPHHH